MIDVYYTLQAEDGATQSQETRSEHVPRVGELISFDPDRSYQVVDVLWHPRDNDSYVSVTALELNWHKHIRKIIADWQNDHERQ